MSNKYQPLHLSYFLLQREACWGWMILVHTDMDVFVCLRWALIVSQSFPHKPTGSFEWPLYRKLEGLLEVAKLGTAQQRGCGPLSFQAKDCPCELECYHSEADNHPLGQFCTTVGIFFSVWIMLLTTLLCIAVGWGALVQQRPGCLWELQNLLPLQARSCLRVPHSGRKRCSVLV